MDTNFGDRDTLAYVLPGLAVVGGVLLALTVTTGFQIGVLFEKYNDATVALLLAAAAYFVGHLCQAIFNERLTGRGPHYLEARQLAVFVGPNAVLPEVQDDLRRAVEARTRLRFPMDWHADRKRSEDFCYDLFSHLSAAITIQGHPSESKRNHNLWGLYGGLGGAVLPLQASAMVVSGAGLAKFGLALYNGLDVWGPLLLCAVGLGAAMALRFWVQPVLQRREETFWYRHSRAAIFEYLAIAGPTSRQQPTQATKASVDAAEAPTVPG